VIRAILAARTAAPGRDLALDAGGPECLMHRSLVLRAARLWENEPRIRSIPFWLARFAVGLLSLVLRRPPITTPMFEILQRDDRADPKVLTKALGIELTPLSETLDNSIGPKSEGAEIETPS
jgi:hypothetical protein